MKKEKFLDTHVDSLLNRDKNIKKLYENVKSEEERTLLKSNLRLSLDNAYDNHARDYFVSKGIGSYFSKALRWGSLATDLVGNYMFWFNAGAGFGLKGVGAAGKTLADYLDNRRYEKHKKSQSLRERIVSRDGLQLAGETVAERFAAYSPIPGFELLDFKRGTSKYDNRVIARTLRQAKESFLDSLVDYEAKIYDVEDARPEDKVISIGSRAKAA